MYSFKYNVNISASQMWCLVLGFICGVYSFYLSLWALKPDNHTLAYIYNLDIFELLKQKQLSYELDDSKRFWVVDRDRAWNGLEIV